MATSNRTPAISEIGLCRVACFARFTHRCPVRRKSLSTGSSGSLPMWYAGWYAAAASASFYEESLRKLKKEVLAIEDPLQSSASDSLKLLLWAIRNED